MFWTKGYHSAQTPESAAAAGVSVGTFYRYFGDKRDVLHEIARRERIWTNMIDDIELETGRTVGSLRASEFRRELEARVDVAKMRPV